MALLMAARKSSKTRIRLPARRERQRSARGDERAREDEEESHQIETVTSVQVL